MFVFLFDSLGWLLARQEAAYRRLDPTKAALVCSHWMKEHKILSGFKELTSKISVKMRGSSFFFTLLVGCWLLACQEAAYRRLAPTKAALVCSHWKKEHKILSGFKEPASKILMKVHSPLFFSLFWLVIGPTYRRSSLTKVLCFLTASRYLVESTQ